MVKDHSDSEKGNPLPAHRLLLSINILEIATVMNNLTLAANKFSFTPLFC